MHGNKKSDLIEWMFGDYKVNSGSQQETREEEEEESILVKPIAQFLCFIPDSVLGLLQNWFVSPAWITDWEGQEYSIKYSPAIIFSGEVPAFDVNFIKPGEAKTVKDTGNIEEYIIQNEETYRQVQSIETEEYEKKLKEIQSTSYDGVLKDREYMFSGDYRQTLKYDIYYKVENNVLIIETIGEYGTKAGDNFVRRYYAYGKQETTSPMLIQSATYESTAAKLQSVIVTWYNTLRKIALVGLLSVLVYIGIKIVLTSTSAKDKAKYKNMLKDWLIALCILFTLHYIMSITITVVESINEILKTSTMSSTGEDIMMTTLRNDIANGGSWGTVIVQVVLYFVLFVYTIIFTIQYLRRTIYIAFLTVIAPLITLTYPLDKIKDSKSQAFDMWIKDYIFFMLLQVVHLLIYYIVVASSLNLAKEENWIFAIIAIGFLVPAEKIIKKMFGFEKSKTLGAVAAGATGALVMNAINKLSRKRWFKRRRRSLKRKRRNIKF